MMKHTQYHFVCFPICLVLFIIAAEVLAISIMANKNISGIK